MMSSDTYQRLAESWPAITQRWLDSLDWNKGPLPAAEVYKQVAANVEAAMRSAIANPGDSKNTGFRASKRQGGRQ